MEGPAYTAVLHAGLSAMLTTLGYAAVDGLYLQPFQLEQGIGVGGFLVLNTLSACLAAVCGAVASVVVLRRRRRHA